ncbi:MAG: ATP-binding protein, partial [Nanoarchaeota archaeon]|nr:ATP-binding protein [Nanoarchaeota archaeon]
MKQDYDREDYQAVKDLQKYQHNLEDRLRFFEDTSTITIPEDPIEKVVFQDKAKKAIRQVAVNKGDMLMVGKPGTGKSLLAEMFSKVLDGSLGDYLRPKKAIVALPGKDENHIVISYTSPESIDNFISNVNKRVQEAKASGSEFSLGDPIKDFNKYQKLSFAVAGISAIGGCFFPPLWVFTGVGAIAGVFYNIQQKNAEMQEITYREIYGKKQFNLKPVKNITPVILFDPRKQQGLMTRVAEPSERSMKGGFKHDPYQSGNLQTPAHKRAYLGAHAKSPILYIDELKTLVNNGYMADLLEIMQEKKYILESGKNTGSGASDRSENEVRAENIIIACCNHDTLGYLKKAGDGAFLSRIEGKGAIIEMESAVPETPENTRQAVQYIKQELVKLENEINENWGEILEKEGKQSVKKRSEKILGRSLPDGYDLNIRQLSKPAVMEIIKELRCRASDKKLSAML